MSYTPRPTAKQVAVLLEFMQTHKTLARGRLQGLDARRKSTDMWKQLATLLNKMGGCIKTVTQWQRYWNDKKVALKKAVGKAKQSFHQTGGGSPKPLSAYEQKILNILGEGYGEGEPSVRISTFQEQQDPILSTSSQPLNCTLNEHEPDTFMESEPPFTSTPAPHKSDPAPARSEVHQDPQANNPERQEGEHAVRQVQYVSQSISCHPILDSRHCTPPQKLLELTNLDISDQDTNPPSPSISSNVEGNNETKRKKYRSAKKAKASRESPLTEAVKALKKVSSQQGHNDECDEFDSFGHVVAKQLRTLPLDMALETEEMILAVLRKQRVSVANVRQFLV